MSEHDPSLAVSCNASYLGFFAHAGFLAGLEERGLRPGELAGSSGGGLAAGLVACGLNVKEVHQILMDPAFTLQFIEFRGLLRLVPLLLNCRGVSGLLTGDKLADHLGKLLPVTMIEDCAVPLHLSAANLTRRCTEIISVGNLSEWIVASCSLPGVFKPRIIHGEAYWDGGLGNEVPIAQWKDSTEVRTVIAHQLQTEVKTPENPGGFSFFRAADHAHRAICSTVLEGQVASLRRAGKRVILVETVVPFPRLIDFAHRSREHCYELGRQSGRSCDLAEYS